MRTEVNTQHPTGEKSVTKEEMSLWFAKVNCEDATLEQLEQLHLKMVVRHPRSANDGKIHWHFVFETDSTRAQTVNKRIRQLPITDPKTYSLKGSELRDKDHVVKYMIRHQKQPEMFPSAMYKVYDDWITSEEIEQAIEQSKLKESDIPEKVLEQNQVNGLIIQLNPKKRTKFSLFAEIKIMAQTMNELNPNKCRTLEDIAKIAILHFKDNPRDIPRADIMRAIVRGVWYDLHHNDSDGSKFADKMINLWSKEE